MISHDDTTLIFLNYFCNVERLKNKGSELEELFHLNKDILLLIMFILHINNLQYHHYFVSSLIKVMTFHSFYVAEIYVKIIYYVFIVWKLYSV